MAQPRLPRLITGMGILCVLRCLTEFAILRLRVGELNPIYFIVSGLDLLLAVLSVAAGLGMARSRPWASWLALVAGGVLVATSIGIGAELAPETYRGLQGSRSRSEALLLLPRLVLYVGLVIFWPWAALRIIGDAPTESRKRRWLAFAGALVLGGAAWGVFILLLRMPK